jgi:hypothetical protein
MILIKGAKSPPQNRLDSQHEFFVSCTNIFIYKACMNFKKSQFGILLFLVTLSSFAAPDKVQLLVWANEAIINSYTYNYKTYLADQKRIAPYFTSNGWIAFDKALNASKLPDAIKKHAYDVTAVATAPPQLSPVDATHWTVIMPILVQYKNPRYQQHQNLQVVLGLSLAPSGEGIRGLSITSLQSTLIKPPCQCMPAPEERATTNETPS